MGSRSRLVVAVRFVLTMPTADAGTSTAKKTKHLIMLWVVYKKLVDFFAQVGWHAIAKGEANFVFVSHQA